MVFPLGDQVLPPTAQTSLHSFSRSQIVAELYRLFSSTATTIHDFRDDENSDPTAD
jgi:hypothetical protein